MLIDIVKRIVTENGDQILLDSKRVRAFFSDGAQNEPKPQKQAFIECLEHEVVKALKDVAEGERASCKESFAQRLSEEEGRTVELYRGAIDIICVVLFGSTPEGAVAGQYNEVAVSNDANSDIEIIGGVFDTSYYDLNVQKYLEEQKHAESGADTLKTWEEYLEYHSEYDKSIAELNKAINLDPNNAIAYNNRGWTYYLKGDYDNAIKDCNKAIGIKPDFAAAYDSRAMAYIGKGEYVLAVADLTKAITFDPNNANRYLNRGNAYRNKGDYDLAMYQDYGDYDLAIADYTTAISLDLNYAEAYNDRGNAYYRKGDYDNAIADYTNAINLDPNDKDVKVLYGNRGNAYREIGFIDEAIADYTQAISLDPNNAAAYNDRGMTHIKCGIDYSVLDDGDKAIADFTKAIRLDPNNANYYFNRGYVYDNKGDYYQEHSWHDLAKYCHTHALDDFNKALSLDPSDGETKRSRDAVWISLGLCSYCGGPLGGILTKRCKTCGREA